jgi:hypothetical protein
VTRTDVIEAVRRVLGRRESTQIFGDHLEIGGLVADELENICENIFRDNGHDRDASVRIDASMRQFGVRNIFDGDDS